MKPDDKKPDPHAFVAVRAEDPDDDAWVEVVGSDQQAYWYRFSGGADGNGNLVVGTRHGKTEFTVTLQNKDEEGFDIGGVSFRDSKGQLSLDMAKTTKKKAFIRDANSAAMNGYYAVLVTREDGRVSISCDPMIKNDPRA
jgi:hypothetical protein